MTDRKTLLLADNWLNLALATASLAANVFMVGAVRGVGWFAPNRKLPTGAMLYAE